MNMETIKISTPEPLNLGRQVIAWQYCCKCGRDLPTNHKCYRKGDN